MKTIDTFVEYYNATENLQNETLFSIEGMENTYNIKLPLAYKYLILNYGDIWTPSISKIVVDNDLELNTLIEFWRIENIIEDKTNEWISNLDENVMPFASDSMGNIFCFKTVDLNADFDNAKIYLYDHNFETIDYIADNFVMFIESYLKIKN